MMLQPLVYTSTRGVRTFLRAVENPDGTVDLPNLVIDGRTCKPSTTLATGETAAQFVARWLSPGHHDLDLKGRWARPGPVGRRLGHAFIAASVNPIFADVYRDANGEIVFLCRNPDNSIAPVVLVADGKVFGANDILPDGQSGGDFIGEWLNAKLRRNGDAGEWLSVSAAGREMAQEFLNSSPARACRCRTNSLRL